MVEYNTCDLCKVQEEVEKLIWDNQQWENIGYKLYKKIFVNEDTYQALCQPCYNKRKLN